MRVILTFVLMTLITSAYSCTDFKLTAQDKTILITRSMEFAIPLKSSLRMTNRNQNFVMNSHLNRSGLSWTNKYGYLYLDGLNTDIVIDGMNEKGLSFEALYLPGITGYQSVPTNQGKMSLPYTQLGAWILGNFDNVEDVKTAIKTIYVYAEKLPNMGDMIFPLHFSIFDTNGNGIVIEYLQGELHVYDNKIGVLTNSPSYDWHLSNLQNYLHLTPYNPKPIQEKGILFAATGQGFGMVGLPGDISPPSRFIKIATMLRVALAPNNANELLNLAQHIINNVDIPLGLVREMEKGTYVSESTQWVVFKDLSNKVLYYRTYDNLNLRSVDLKKINFDSPQTPTPFPIDEPSVVQDKTQEFLKH